MTTAPAVPRDLFSDVPGLYRTAPRGTAREPWYASSEAQDWGTPPGLFGPLHARFGFTVDAAATPLNRLVDRHYEDAFRQSWRGERVWCNPPYGRWQVPFVREAARREADLSVLLLPVRADTAVWHECIWDRAEVWFLRGRVRFVGAKSGSTFASAIVLFRPDDRRLRVRHGTLADMLDDSRWADR